MKTRGLNATEDTLWFSRRYRVILLCIDQWMFQLIQQQSQEKPIHKVSVLGRMPTESMYRNIFLIALVERPLAPFL